MSTVCLVQYSVLRSVTRTFTSCAHPLYMQLVHCLSFFLYIIFLMLGKINYLPLLWHLPLVDL